MSEKQRKFIDYILQGHSATSAAKHAGYSEASAHTQGYRLLQNEDIKREIAQRREISTSGAILTAVQIKERLTTIIETPSYKPLERIRALELLAKINGLFTDSNASTVNVVIDSLKDSSYQELQELEAKLCGSST